MESRDDKRRAGTGPQGRWGRRVGAGALAMALFLCLLWPGPAALAEGGAETGAGGGGEAQRPPAQVASAAVPGAGPPAGNSAPGSGRAGPEGGGPALPTAAEGGAAGPEGEPGTQSPEGEASAGASAPGAGRAGPAGGADAGPPTADEATAGEAAGGAGETIGEAGDEPGAVEIRFWVGGAQDTALTQWAQPGGWIEKPSTAPPVPPGLAAFRGWYLDPLAGETAAPFDFESPLPAGAPAGGLDLYALFAARYTLRYLGADGAVRHTKTYAPGQSVPGLSPAEAAAITGPEGQPPAHWALAEDAAETPLVFGFPAAADLTLKPCFAAAFQVVYVSAGGPVAGSPQAVASGGVASPPSPPARAGYTFMHWSQSPGGPAYDFAAPVSADLVLYALWQAEETADYTVVFWLEEANLSADPGFAPTPGTPGHYRAVHSLALRGAAGAAPGHRAEDFAAVMAGQAGPAALKYADIQHITDPVLAPDGSTLVQVYCTRRVYTLEFDLGHKNIGTSLAVGGVSYRGTGAPYSFRAKYGQDISALYPFPPAAAVRHASGYNFAGWRPQGAADEGGWYAARPSLDAGMLPADGNNGTILLTAAWTQGSTRMTARFYAEALPHQLADNAIKKYLHAGVWYCEMENSPATAPTLQWNAPSFAGLAPVAAAGVAYASFDIRGRPEDKTADRYFLYRRQWAALAFNTLAPAVPAPAPLQLMAGQRLADAPAEPPRPQRPGYSFGGWYLDEACTRPVDWDGASGAPATLPAEGLVLFARWLPRLVTVTYTDPALGRLAELEWPAGAPLAHPEAFAGSPARYLPGAATAGRGVFQGWACVAGGRLVPCPQGLAPGEDLILIALWRASGLTVRYDRGLGLAESAPPQGGSYAAGQSLCLPGGQGLVPPPGMAFAGWRPLGLANAPLWLPGASVTVEEDLVLEAQYLPAAGMRTVELRANGPGGEAPVACALASGQPVLLPAAFARAGYRLAGWCASPRPGPEDTVYPAEAAAAFAEEDLPPVLYAVWVRTGQVLVSFQVAGGTLAPGAQAVFALQAGQPLAALAGFALPATLPEVAGATWAGWASGYQGPHSPGTPWPVGPGVTAPVCEDLTITGVYLPPAATYSVCFRVPRADGGADEILYEGIPAGTPWAEAGISVPQPQPPQPHLVFSGWALVGDDEDDPAAGFYADAQALAQAGLVMDQNLTLTAEFSERPKTTVAFVAQGPGSLNGGAAVCYGEAYAGLSWAYNGIALPAAAPGAKAWFVGWFGADGAPLTEAELNGGTLVPAGGAVYTAKFAPQSPLILRAGSGSFAYDGLYHPAADLPAPYTAEGLAAGHYVAAAQVAGGAATPAQGATRVVPGSVVVRARQGAAPAATDPDVTHRYDLAYEAGSIAITRHSPAGGRLVYLAQGLQTGYAGRAISHTANGILMLETPEGAPLPCSLPPNTAIGAHRSATATGRDAGRHPMAWDAETPGITLVYTGEGGPAEVTDCFEVEYRLGALEISPAPLTVAALPGSVAFGQAPSLGLAATAGTLLGEDATPAGTAADLATLLGLEGRPLLESAYRQNLYIAPRLDIAFTAEARAAAAVCRNYTVTLVDSTAAQGGGLAVTDAVRVGYQNPLPGAEGSPPAASTVPAGTRVPVATGSGLLAHPDYDFAGWRAEDGSLYPAGGTGLSLLAEEDTTLTAVWAFRPGAFGLQGFSRPYNGRPAATALAGPLRPGDRVEYTMGNESLFEYEWETPDSRREHTALAATPGPAAEEGGAGAGTVTVTIRRQHVEPLTLAAPARITPRRLVLRAFSRTAVATGGAVVAVPDPAAGLPAPGFAPDAADETGGLLPGHRVVGAAAQAAASAPGSTAVAFVYDEGGPRVLDENGGDVTANYAITAIEGRLELLAPAGGGDSGGPGPGGENGSGDEGAATPGATSPAAAATGRAAAPAGARPGAALPIEGQAQATTALPPTPPPEGGADVPGAAGSGGPQNAPPGMQIGPDAGAMAGAGANKNGPPAFWQSVSAVASVCIPAVVALAAIGLLGGGAGVVPGPPAARKGKNPAAGGRASHWW